MRKFHKPIRMCVVCRGRFFQSDLYKLAANSGIIAPAPKDVRAFYVCAECAKKDEKTLKKSLSRFGKIESKEIFING